MKMTNQEAIDNIKELLCWYLEEEPLSETVYKRESVEKAIETLEKQIPKKPVKGNGDVFAYMEEWYADFRCPKCNEKVYEEDYEGYSIALYPACSCGQKIDWSDIR